MSEPFIFISCSFLTGFILAFLTNFNITNKLFLFLSGVHNRLFYEEFDYRRFRDILYTYKYYDKITCDNIPEIFYDDTEITTDFNYYDKIGEYKLSGECWTSYGTMILTKKYVVNSENMYGVPNIYENTGQIVYIYLTWDEKLNIWNGIYTVNGYFAPCKLLSLSNSENIEKYYIYNNYSYVKLDPFVFLMFSSIFILNLMIFLYDGNDFDIYFYKEYKSDMYWPNFNLTIVNLILSIFSIVIHYVCQFKIEFILSNLTCLISQLVITCFLIVSYLEPLDFIKSNDSINVINNEYLLPNNIDIDINQHEIFCYYENDVNSLFFTSKYDDMHCDTINPYYRNLMLNFSWFTCSFSLLFIISLIVKLLRYINILK